MNEIREYVDRNGLSPFARWFDGLNAQAAQRVRRATLRMEQGNLSNVKGVGSGVSEYRIDFGPGYRLYFGQEGDRIIILLGGGTKKLQNQDIAKAKALWQEYKARKHKES